VEKKKRRDEKRTKLGWWFVRPLYIISTYTDGSVIVAVGAVAVIVYK
jgi:hypothetical protein